jgi:hypothetical protein
MTLLRNLPIHSKALALLTCNAMVVQDGGRVRTLAALDEERERGEGSLSHDPVRCRAKAPASPASR